MRNVEHKLVRIIVRKETEGYIGIRTRSINRRLAGGEISCI